VRSTIVTNKDVVVDFPGCVGPPGGWTIVEQIVGIPTVVGRGNGYRQTTFEISGSALTQQQALLTSFLVLMPSAMLSDFLFPVANMPESIRIATFGNPMRWYL